MTVLDPAIPLREHICQDGVRPGPRKLAQFRQALQLRNTPALYSQEGQGDQAIVYVKLFDPCGGATWYLLEWDGQDEAFCWCEGLGTDEYGYLSLPELACVKGRFGIGIEIDTGFLPTPLGKCRKE
jgi:hypothetical protein